MPVSLALCFEMDYAWLLDQLIYNVEINADANYYTLNLVIVFIPRLIARVTINIIATPDCSSCSSSLITAILIITASVQKSVGYCRHSASRVAYWSECLSCNGIKAGCFGLRQTRSERPEAPLMEAKERTRV